jgi:RHS repeat-associated protein
MKRIFSAICTSVMVSILAVAQAVPPTNISASNDTGMKPQTPYSVGVGNVNLTNGNLTLEIPLINLPGRAGNALSVALQYDSKVWVPHYTIVGPYDMKYDWQIEKRDPQVGAMGWRINSTFMSQGGWKTDQFGNFAGNLPDVITMKDGGKHGIGETFVGAGIGLDSTDGSFLSIDPDYSIYLVRTKSGEAIDFTSGGYTDSNGNTSTDFQDTLGRDVTVSSSQPFLGYPAQIDTLKYKDSNGVLQTITFHYSLLTLLADSGQYQVPSPKAFQYPLDQRAWNFHYRTIVTQPARNQPYVLLTSIELPDGQTYSFQYNGFGELTRLDLPTGGYATYGYGTFIHAENWRVMDDGGLPKAADFHEVTARTVCDGSGTCGTTTYSPTVDQWKFQNVQMDEVESAGTANAHLTQHFIWSNQPNGTACDKFYSPREYQSYSYAGATTSSQLLQGVSTFFNTMTGSCGDAFLPTDIQTTLYDTGGAPLVKLEHSDYDTYLASAVIPFNYNPGEESMQHIGDVLIPIDNVIERREYDWGPGAPGPLLRTTKTEWVKDFNPGDGAYVARNTHILNRPKRITVLNPSGVKTSETLYEYDHYIDQLTPSNATHHQSVSGKRGNLTALSQWLDTTNSYFVSHFEYDDAGNAVKATDPRNNVTLMSYGDSWENAACMPTGNAAAYLTRVENAKHHITTAKYNSCTGTMASVIDPNLKTTSWVYDLWARITQIKYPPQTASGGEIDLVYPDPNHVNRTEKLTSTGLWQNNIFTLDGIGRVNHTKLVDPISGDIIVDTTYDEEGRVKSVTNPYVTTSDPTYGITTWTYDALDRTKQVQHPDLTVVTTDYAGNQTTVRDEAGKHRRTFADGLSRLIRVDEFTGSGAISEGVSATSGTGTVTFNGSERTYPIECGGLANSGGSESKSSDVTPNSIDPGECLGYDSGWISVSVNGYTKVVNYGQTSSKNALASSLASLFNADSNSPVSAGSSSNVITFTARTAGSATNYSISSSAASDVMGGSSFTGSPSGATLTGGANGVPASSRYTTLYIYNALGNFICVEQHGNTTGTGCSSAEASDSTSPWRVRRFTYDSLSRLTRAKNPESGVINYTYPTPAAFCSGLGGDISAVCSKTDARNIAISYSYDELNRLKGKTYSNGDPAVTYFYDSTVNGSFGIGRRSGMQVGSASNSASWTYDETGRATLVSRTVNGYTKAISYSYNPNNSVASIAYPSGKVVNHSISASGRLLDVSTGTRKFMSGTCGNGVCYTPSGAILSGKLGANITLTNAYNSRLQPTLLSATGLAPLMSRNYDFIGNVTDNGETGNNSNIYRITDNLDPLNIPNRATGSTVFKYDQLNRITQAKTTGTDCTSMGGAKNWGNTYNIDPWGNLTNKGAVTGLTGCFAENMNEAVGVDNRFTGANRYDAAGNMTGNGAYVFDAENRIITAGGFTYSYDGDGNRASKTGRLYWRGTGTEELAESDATGALTAEYIYFGGRRIARLDTPNVATPPAHYYLSDHLGSATVIASEAGGKEREIFYFPFGGEQSSNGTDPNHYKFTGKERDTETGLDYFGARFYGSSMGRWLSPDWAASPEPVPYVDLSDPQTLNLYGYVRNNPTNRFDVDGHAPAAGLFRRIARKIAEEAAKEAARRQWRKSMC